MFIFKHNQNMFGKNWAKQKNCQWMRKKNCSLRAVNRHESERDDYMLYSPLESKIHFFSHVIDSPLVFIFSVPCCFSFRWQFSYCIQNRIFSVRLSTKISPILCICIYCLLFPRIHLLSMWKECVVHFYFHQNKFNWLLIPANFYSWAKNST